MGRRIMRKEKLFTAGHRAVLFFCRFPPAGSEKIRQKDERDFSGDHEGGKGIDFRRNPSLHHGVDVKRESCRIRPAAKKLMMKSSMDSVKAMSAPAVIPGMMRGSVM